MKLSNENMNYYFSSKVPKMLFLQKQNKLSSRNKCRLLLSSILYIYTSIVIHTNVCVCINTHTCICNYTYHANYNESLYQISPESGGICQEISLLIVLLMEIFLSVYANLNSADFFLHLSLWCDIVLFQPIMPTLHFLTSNL